MSLFFTEASNHPNFKVKIKNNQTESGKGGVNDVSTFSEYRKQPENETSLYPAASSCTFNIYLL